MKRQIIKLIFFFAVGSCLYSQEPTQIDSIPNFRGIEWGESIQGVRSLELAKYDQLYIGFGVHILTFHDTHLNYYTKIDYVFEEEKLKEAFYTIETESFEETFQNIKASYINRFGRPNYWSSSHPDASINSVFESESDYCRGPEIYWEFCNGFLGIISEKYKETITITILFVHEKTIEDYGKFVVYPY